MNGTDSEYNLQSFSNAPIRDERMPFHIMFDKACEIEASEVNIVRYDIRDGLTFSKASCSSFDHNPEVVMVI